MKKFTLLSCFISLMILSGCASMRNSEITPGLGTTLDATTTYYGLAHAGATEANPLLSWGNPVTSALGSVAIKQGVKYAAVNYMHADPFTVDTNVESAGVAAGIWNIGALAGVNPILGLAAAITSAYGYYQYRQYSHAVEQAENPGYATDQSYEEQPRQNKRAPLLATQAKAP